MRFFVVLRAYKKYIFTSNIKLFRKIFVKNKKDTHTTLSSKIVKSLIFDCSLISVNKANLELKLICEYCRNIQEIPFYKFIIFIDSNP